MKIKIENADKRFPKSSLTLEPGILNLIGCNRSGKSTLLRRIKNAVSAMDDCVAFDVADFVAGVKLASHMHAKSSGDLDYTLLTDFVIDCMATVRLNHPGKKVILFFDNPDRYQDRISIGFFLDFLRFVQKEERDNELYFLLAGSNPATAETVLNLEVTTFKYYKNVSYRKYISLINSSAHRINKQLKEIDP